MATVDTSVTVAQGTKGSKATTKANVPASVADIKRLLDASIDAKDKVENIGAQLSVAFYSALKAKDVDPGETYGWLQMTDKKLSAAYLEDLCVLYSSKYRAAQDEVEAIKADKSITEENKKSRGTKAKRQIAAARANVRKGVIVGYWLHKMNPEKVVVRDTGLIRITHKKEELDGVFTLANLLKLGSDAYAKKGPGRAPKSGQGNTNIKDQPPLDVTKSVSVSATYLNKHVMGKAPTDFNEASRAELRDLFVSLIGVFGTVGDQVDTDAIRDIYKAAKTGN